MNFVILNRMNGDEVLVNLERVEFVEKYKDNNGKVHGSVIQYNNKFINVSEAFDEIYSKTKNSG